jgi:hypothetical protein
MDIGTLLRYLVGDRQAILKIAADRRAIGLGFLFVLSAAFAREYDGKDLLHEPWHLAIPLVVSLIASYLLFGLTYGRFEAPRRRRQAEPNGHRVDRRP